MKPHSLPEKLHSIAAQICLVGFDVDGTLTDGRLYYDSQGRESKAFCSVDGLGLKLLQEYGIEPVLITARNSAAATQRGIDLGVETLVGISDKLTALRTLCAQRGIDLQQASFMGDDLVDLAPLRAVGLAVAPANAHPAILPYIHWQTQAPGGLGAARELCDALLAAQGKEQAIFTRFSL